MLAVIVYWLGPPPVVAASTQVRILVRAGFVLFCQNGISLDIMYFHDYGMIC